MTSVFLLDDLKRDEGFRAKAYPDPISGGAPWTVGYGFTGPGIGPLTTMTQDEADDELKRRVLSVTSNLLTALPWLSTLEPERADVLVNMAYNMGLHDLLGFRNTLSLIQAGKYDEAADAMAASLWAKQVPTRAARLAEQMQTGIHQP